MQSSIVRILSFRVIRLYCFSFKGIISGYSISSCLHVREHIIVVTWMYVPRKYNFLYLFFYSHYSCTFYDLHDLSQLYHWKESIYKMHSSILLLFLMIYSSIVGARNPLVVFFFGSCDFEIFFLFMWFLQSQNKNCNSINLFCFLDCRKQVRLILSHFVWSSQRAFRSKFCYFVLLHLTSSFFCFSHASSLTVLYGPKVCGDYFFLLSDAMNYVNLSFSLVKLEGGKPLSVSYWVSIWVHDCTYWIAISTLRLLILSG